jgi:uncharacterized protein
MHTHSNLSMTWVQKKYGCALKMSRLKWNSEGLVFKCTGCGACCTGSPGYVWLSESDIDDFCKHLKLKRADFLKRYTRLVGKRYSLLEDPKNFDCVFLDGKKCTVYEARPRQCRTFPWWRDNIKTSCDWDETAQGCEGVNHPEGRMFTQKEIDQVLDS